MNLVLRRTEISQPQMVSLINWVINEEAYRRVALGLNWNENHYAASLRNWEIVDTTERCLLDVYFRDEAELVAFRLRTEVITWGELETLEGWPEGQAA